MQYINLVLTHINADELNAICHQCDLKINEYRKLSSTQRKIGGKDNILHRKMIHKLTIQYDDVRIGAMASQITSLTIVYSTVYSGADQSTHQSSASLAFVWGIHWGPVNSPHKGLVTGKMFPFDDVIIWAKASLPERNVASLMTSPVVHIVFEDCT